MPLLGNHHSFPLRKSPCRNALMLKALPWLTNLYVSRAMMSTSSTAAATTTTGPIHHNVQRMIESPTFDTWPFQPEDFNRRDESSDVSFYSQPRFVKHIDDECIASLSNVYSQLFHENDAVLDLCSSWISHFPTEPSLGNVVGVGMNEQELAANDRLDSYVVKDLNHEPLLPFEDESFDYVVNAVSVDYLSNPKEIFNEMWRVLKPNGVAVMSWSNRMFPTKVIDMWLRVSEEERVKIVQAYFLHNGAPFTNVHGYEMKTTGTDPLYVVVGEKSRKQNGGRDSASSSL